jgi:diguanylate cyclase (GGDEF)-like protein
MVAGAVIAAIATGFTFRAIREEADAQQWVAHTLEARQQIAELLASVRGAGTGIRVFLLTHDDALLEPYRATVDTIPRRMSTLAATTADNPTQRESIEVLRRLIARRMARFDDYLHGAEPTAEWLKAGNTLMDDIQRLTASMDAEEARLLALRTAAARSHERFAEVLSSMGLACSIGLALLGWWLQRLDLRRENQHMRLLYVGSTVSNRSTASREALQGCLDEICDVMGWPAAHAHVLEGGKLISSELWHLPAGRNFGFLREAMKGVVVEPGTGLSGRVMATRRPSWFTDVSSEPPEAAHQPVRDALREAGFRGILGLPVLAGDEVPAVLEFFTESPAAPDAEMLEIMSSIGVQVGRVFERELARAQQEEQTRKIESLSVTDELTGLHNRRGFLTMAAQQLKLSRRAKESCHLFFMDMDGLKRINDELGHGAGDAALQEVARVLRGAFREPDIVARLGGDEFVAFAPCASSAAESVTERIQERLKGHIAGEDPRYPLRVSVGLTCVDPQSNVPIDDVLAAADEAMYEKKRERRREA